MQPWVVVLYCDDNAWPTVSPKSWLYDRGAAVAIQLGNQVKSKFVATNRHLRR